MPGHEGMEVHVHGQVTPARGADGDLKLRSVCDACTSAKLRCNGKTPCERCIKKGIQCHYQPFKHRGAGGSDKTKNKSANNSDEFGDNFLDEYERKTWSVFFTLYRSFSKGCSLFWFKQQLFRMLKFLETKADSDAPAANALLRLKSWMIALGLDVTNPPPPCVRNIPRFQFTKTTMVSFQSTLDDLKNDAVRRNLPMLSISEDGAVSVNEAFTAVFEPSQELLQRTLDDAGGGFLPWGGDMLARILSKENDLVLYIQSVSDAIDAIGKPSGIPSIQVVPTMNIVRARKRDGQDVLCIVRGIQRLSFEPESISFSTDIVFELPDSSSGGVQTVPSRARPFSETAMAAMDETEFNKLLETEPYDVLPLPQDALGGPGDEEWLDSLLDWANETSDGNPVMAMLPVSDEQWH